MYVRVTTIQGTPDKIDDAKGHLQEQTLPQLQEMEGFKGFVALGNRQSGKLQGVAFWESEEALRATDQAVSGVRSGAAEAADGTVVSVEEYEVFVNEAPSAGPLGRGHGHSRWGDGHGGRCHETGKWGNGHSERNHRQAAGGRREEELEKGRQQVPTQGEARAGTDKTPALLLHASIHRSAWKGYSPKFKFGKPPTPLVYTG